MKPSKVWAASVRIGLALAALVFAGTVTTVQATPTCTTTVVLPGGNGTLLDSTLTSGVCVESGDKLYGNFNFGTIPLSGSVTFAEAPGDARHSITFSAPFLPGNTYTDSYEVMVLPGGGPITKLSADVTQTSGTLAFLETPSTPPLSGSIFFIKTANVVTGNFVANYSLAQNVTDLILSSTLVTGPGSDASAVLNSTLESATRSVPEPATLELLGIAITGLAIAFRRKAA